MDNQGYELFGEIALKNQRFFFFIPPCILTITTSALAILSLLRVLCILPFVQKNLETNVVDMSSLSQKCCFRESDVKCTALVEGECGNPKKRRKIKK